MAPLFILVATAVLPPQPAAPFLRASAGGTATVQIVTPARVGEGLGAPRPGMKPRLATLSVPGGSSRTLLVYDFE